ncbi:hypothetical protein FJ251_14745 [bacterium]|nr:hypothetical protein [bacterium]
MRTTLGLPLLLALAACAGASRAPDASPAASAAAPLPSALAARNAPGALFAPAAMDSILAAEQTLPTRARIGRWARRFLADPASEYRFGLKPGGYVAEGLLVSDHRQDCVSLLYRCCELARARDHEDALRIALATRFAGAPLDSLTDAEGRVDYDRPEHLDYSLDMVRSGHWGADVTASLSGARPDPVGSSRYPAGSFLAVPEAALVADELNEGDIVWFVTDPTHPGARKQREELGIVIGHIGIVVVEKGERRLIHAASSALPGEYTGGRIESVPLSTYLARVERYGSGIVTRFAQ